MYERLTKTVTQDGKQCVTCKYYGTKECRIHTGTSDCGHCEVFAAMLNQLYEFEEIIEGAQKERS